MTLLYSLFPDASLNGLLLRIQIQVACVQFLSTVISHVPLQKPRLFAGVVALLTEKRFLAGV